LGRKYITDKTIIMNWGYKILVVYGIFVVGIMVMVFKSSGEDFDLVTDDYYAKELLFQQQIDAAGRTNALSEKVKSEVKNGRLVVHFPKDFNGKKISGQMQLYYAADKAKDITSQFAVETTSADMAIPAANTGMHELHVNWKVDGVSYYFEEKIFL
jgi:hypothetical protein